MMAESEYTPIDCTNHDQLEDLATRRRQVRVVHRDDGGTEREARSVIVDVFSRDAAEWIRLEDGTEIRLDRLVTVEGRPVS